MDKEITVMPKDLNKGIGKYINKKEGISVAMRVIIIILVFALILVSIGTIIIINSYNSNPVTVSGKAISK